MVEVRRPPVQASSCEFGVFSGSRGEACEVPARRIGLANHDHPDTLAWPEIQWLGKSEEAILVRRFDGTHAHEGSTIARPQISWNLVRSHGANSELPLLVDIDRRNAEHELVDFNDDRVALVNRHWLWKTR